METWRQEALPGRSNLIARLPGRNPGRRLVFETHTNTVSAGGMAIPPFNPLVSEGRLYGRIACDTKVGLAAIAFAAAGLKRNGIVPPCEIWVVAAADEEHSFAGVHRLLQTEGGSAAVMSEPTEMRVASGSKGVLRWSMGCHGKAAHNSRPHLGLNAISNIASPILLLEWENARLQSVPHPFLGTATLNVGVIEGGRPVNIVPDLCTAALDRRLLPGESNSLVFDHYKSLLPPEFGIRFDPPMLEDEEFETPTGSELVKCTRLVARSLGLNHDPIGVPFGTHASKFSRAGIPSIICGPGSIDQARTADEYVECRQVEIATQFYRELMLTFE
jgi:acetylornithine deacetylase/succinyl-diaminopimelate desuccinylase-like protein